MLRTMAVFIALAGSLTIPCAAQKDSVKTLKNNIRVNITNPLIFSPQYNIIGYERVITDHQTASISLGRFALRKFKDIEGDSVGIEDQYHDKGFNVSFDYRFYLKSENRHNAPRGVYLGPYYAFNYFSREITWDIKTSSFTGAVNTNFDFTANLIGLQMGYQFVIWNRLTIDMILIGPGLWFLKVKTGFDTTLSPEDEALLLEKINGFVKEKFPASDLVFTGENFEAKKVAKTSTAGLRYMINIGFRF